MTAARGFLVPDDLPGPSGGSVYNTQVMAVWETEGLGVTQARVPGSWPHPDHRARQALPAALRSHTSVLVDGIIASAAPDEIAHAVAGGVEVSVLMHLPLPAETGLSTAARKASAASERAALHHATRVICTSQWARQDLTSRYGVASTAVAAPGAAAAPLARGSALPQSGDNTVPQLLFLGAISHRKNPLLLLRALSDLDHHLWRLTLAGPAGEDQDYVRAVTAAAQVFSDRVEMPGPLSGRSLDRLWDATDLLVLPSLAETYGMVVTEAISRGIPALVGSGTGAEEALAAGVGAAQPDATPPGGALLPGQTVDPTDASAWSAAVGSWLHDADLRQQWRTTAIEHRDRLPLWRTTATRLKEALGW